MLVIPRPLEDLEMTLPKASCWIEKPLVELEMLQSTPDKLPALLGEDSNSSSAF
jgi:hypothetical protein